MMSAEFLRALNEKQREAVEATEGPLIVLAGAGSGKTKMLTSRITHLMVHKGVSPHSILAVTFTNKAAKEMRERVEKFSGGNLGWNTPEIGTFHSVCLKILRFELASTPYVKPFVIYDDSDQLSLIKTICRKMTLDEKQFNPKAIQATINRAKCDAVEASQYQPANFNHFQKKVREVYELYQNELFAQCAIDFGEIICLTYRLFRDNPEIRQKYQKRFKYIHVDEYQDTNRAQYLLLSALAGKTAGGHQNICVVGDEDQSIYKWRGADIRNILDFEADYPGAQIVKLEQNYRSTQTILAAASHVIKNNRERREKTLWTENEAGHKIVRVKAPDERVEAEFVISEIKRLAHEETYALKDFTIFYRTHAQSRQFEDVLRREKIAYQIYGGLRFYDRKEIKDILSYFRVLINPLDSVSIKRIINTPTRGIGKTTLDKVEEYQIAQERARGQVVPYWQALLEAAGLEHPDPAVPATTILTGAALKKLQGFIYLIEQFREKAKSFLPTELFHWILEETGYVRELKEEATDEALARIENLEEFDNLLQEFEEDQFAEKTDAEQAELRPRLLDIYIEQATLDSDSATRAEQAELDRLSMMSLHSSKGLEFPVVFMVGMEEGLFPSIRPWEEGAEEEIEEERRLCYVGITRARERLYMSHVGVRRLWGETHYQEPARFFAEIPDSVIDERDLSYGSVGFVSRRSSEFRSTTQTSTFGGSKSFTGSAHVLHGAKFIHPDYGAGRVVAVEGSGEQEKVVVEFSAKDKRKFITKYVRQFIDID